MSKIVDLNTYHSLYCAIQENPRFTIKKLFSLLKMGGRGQKYSTVTSQIAKLYERKISLRPNLVLRTFENCHTKAYFLKVKNSESISSAFHTLMQNPKLSYMLFLSGKYDFFVTSKYDLNFGKDLKIEKKSISYTPVYTVPYGWNCEVKDVLRKIAGLTLLKGKIERRMEDWLPWNEIHYRIYEIMKNNVQIPFSHVAKKTDFSSNTIKKYFYKTVLPYCNITHYFFPEGYDHYQQSFIIARSCHEKGLLNAFSRMPCTSYFFPLEEEIILILFHENINDLMSAIRKLEEKGYIEKYLLQVPLHWE